MEQVADTNNAVQVRITAPAQAGNAAQSWEIDTACPIVELPYLSSFQWQRTVGWQTQPKRPLIELDAAPLRVEELQLYQFNHLKQQLQTLAIKLHDGVCTSCGATINHSGPAALQAQIQRLSAVEGVLCLALVIDADTAQERANRATLYAQQYLLVDYILQRSDLAIPDNDHLAVVLATFEPAQPKFSQKEIQSIFERLPQAFLDLYLIADRSKPAQHIDRFSPSGLCNQCGKIIPKIDLSDLSAVFKSYQCRGGKTKAQIFEQPFSELIGLLRQNCDRINCDISNLCDFVQFAVELGLERLNFARYFSSLSAGERLKFALAAIATSPLHDALIVSRNWKCLCDRTLNSAIAPRLSLRGCNFTIFKLPAQSHSCTSGSLRNVSSVDAQNIVRLTKVELPNITLASVELAIGRLNRVIGPSGSGKSALLSQALAQIGLKQSQPKIFECTEKQSLFRQILIATPRTLLRASTVSELSGLSDLSPKSARREEIITLLDQFGFETSDIEKAGSLVSDAGLQRLLLVKALATSSERAGARRRLAKRGRLILVDDPGIGCNERGLNGIFATINTLLELGDTVVVSDSIGFLADYGNLHEILLSAC